MKQETIIHLETMWKRGLSLNKRDTWAPNESVAPLLSLMCSQWGANYIYRQIHSLDDLEVWCKAVAASNDDHRKILWLSGHGGKKRAFCFHEGNKSIEVDAEKILEAVGTAGKLTGLVIDSCSFGKHIKKREDFPKNVNWVIATYKDVDFIGSSFVFAKAIEWLTEGAPKNFRKNYKKGMSTDNEKKKNERVSYDKLVKTMGIRLFYLKDNNLQTI